MRTTIPLVLIALAALALSFSATAHAGRTKNRLYGWELEFTNPKLQRSLHGWLSAVANNTNYDAREKWAGVVKKLCAETKGCRVREIEDWISWRKGDGDVVWSYEIASYRFTFKDGFWFQLSLDPSVVEVQMIPSTVKMIRDHEAQLQSYVFDTAKAAGLKPFKYAETHLHIGADAAFGMNLKDMRNFLVDGVNHPEWAYLFARGFNNAPPMILLGEDKYEIFREIVANVDAGRIKTVDDFITQIRKRVYDDTFDPDMVSDFDKAQKYQQWNIERLRKKVKLAMKTFENRSVPAPQEASDMTGIVELFDARIEWVLAKKKPIELAPWVEKLSQREQVKRFRAYVTEAGLKVGDYRHFMKPACAALLTRK